MAEVTFFDFLNKIAARKESFPVTIIYGFNEFLGEKIIAAFCSNFIETKSDFNYRRYYADIEGEANWEEITSEANSSSFFLQSRKIIVVTIREEKYLTLKKNEKEVLKGYVSHPNPNTILVIYISLNLIKDDYKQVKKLKIDKFIKELDAPKIYNIDLDKIQEREVKNYIQSYLKACNISITANALDKIMEMREDDFISVLYQLPKLAIADVQGGSLDSGDIDTIISGVEAHSIWELADAIENEDIPSYLKILNYLFTNGIKAALIIGTLITHYNKIYIAKFLLKHKMPAGEIGRALEQHPFFLDKFIQTARNFSEKRLRNILEIIYNLDYESKTSGEDSARLSLQNFPFRIRLINQK
ncbi:MAG: DNA polymerase III subunit delta [Acidobacteria bacterium]|jgi:DNA polymerase-3 subunit delta|nr:DNA polymerase III subunit delta [Acidobacteriota bacterium]